MMVMGSRCSRGCKERKSSCSKGNAMCKCIEECESVIANGVMGTVDVSW